MKKDGKTNGEKLRSRVKEKDRGVTLTLREKERKEGDGVRKWQGSAVKDNKKEDFS